ncbi:MAG: O-antigen ligase family protein [Actinobacteria bacterium]|nr:O-antigen ligase family protein [Actinomycetota bacterium]
MSLHRNGNLGRVPLHTWLPTLATLYALAVATLQFSHAITTPQMLTLLIGPVLALLAVLRPAWPVLIILAAPPVLLSGSGVALRDLTLLLLVIIATSLLTRGGLIMDWRSPLIPFALLLIGAAVFQSEVGPLAAATTTSVLQSFIYFGLMGFSTYCLALYRELTLKQLEWAIVISATGTALILLFLSGFSINTLLANYLGSEGTQSFEIYRTHFGMLMVMGLGIALTRPFHTDGVKWRQRFGVADIALVAFLVAMTAFSFTRAAWLCAAVVAALISLRTSHKAYAFIPLLIACGVLLVPVFNERAFADLEGGLQQAAASGRLGSGRWGLWNLLWDRVIEVFPSGHGFGYVWTLSSRELFGLADVFVTAQNPLVYPHNDFLFWLLELGAAGVALYLLFWTGLLRRWANLSRHPSPVAKKTSLVLGTTLIAMLIGEIFDNALFMRPIAERFFAVAGFLIGTAVLLGDAQDDQRAGAGRRP